MANDQIYFHGAKKGKKIDLIKEKSNASFNVLETYSLLPSYFSTDDGKACPATHLYKSIVIERNIEFVENYNEKITKRG
jgi:nitroimidazol reductase NimA-like FMN-containing flavoprotein (pyridoxamine 5'-phosphate oxidase superfamily)